MTGTESQNRCAIAIVASGFDEMELVAVLSGLRRAGMQAKSVGLVSGLICGAHGIWLMPDLTLTDLFQEADTADVDLVILPGGDAYVAAIEPDPRVRRLLGQISERGGWIAMPARTLKTLRDTLPAPANLNSEQIMLHFPEQLVEAFIEELVLRYSRQVPEMFALSAGIRTSAYQRQGN